MKFAGFAKIVVVSAMMLSGPTLAFASSYDSIAVDGDAGTKAGNAGYGVGEGDSSDEAKRDAMKNCKSSGNHHCEVEVTYRQCGAYASSREHSGNGIGSTEGEAKRNAMSECGNSSCKIVVSDCVGK